MSEFLRRYALLFIAIVLDLIFSAFISNAFGYRSFIVTPYFGLFALLLTTRKKDYLSKILITFIYGVFLELQLVDSNFIVLFSLLLGVSISTISWEILGDSVFEKGIILYTHLAIIIFTKFMLAKLFGLSSASWLSFLTYEFVITMIVNLVFLLIVLAIDSKLIDRSIQLERIKKRSEHISIFD